MGPAFRFNLSHGSQKVHGFIRFFCGLGGLEETCVARASYMSHDVRVKGGFGFFFSLAHRFWRCRRGQAGKAGIFRGEDLGGRSGDPYTTEPVRCSHVARRFSSPRAIRCPTSQRIMLSSGGDDYRGDAIDEEVIRCQ